MKVLNTVFIFVLFYSFETIITVNEFDQSSLWCLHVKNYPSLCEGETLSCEKPSEVGHIPNLLATYNSTQDNNSLTHLDVYYEEKISLCFLSRSPEIQPNGPPYRKQIKLT